MIECMKYTRRGARGKGQSIVLGVIELGGGEEYNEIGAIINKQFMKLNKTLCSQPQPTHD